MQNYIGNLRTKIGHDKLIHPAARIIIENEKMKSYLLKKSIMEN